MHDLNTNNDFNDIGNLIKKIVEKKIIKYYQIDNFEIEIEKLWFTITKKSGKMKKHHHLDGDLSSVFYLKCDDSPKSSFINLYNYQNNLKVYEAKSINENFNEKNFL